MKMYTPIGAQLFERARARQHVATQFDALQDVATQGSICTRFLVPAAVQKKLSYPPIPAHRL
jgi:hypothetical protein